MAVPKIPTIGLEVQKGEKTILESNRTYANHSYCFALCSEIKNKKTKQLMSLHSCRESCVGIVVNHFKGQNKSLMMPDLSTRKTTVLIWTSFGQNDAKGAPDGCKGPHSEWIVDSMRAGVRLLNCFERDNKWLKSKLYRVDLPGNPVGSFVHVIEGSRWWMTSPYTLSLFLLLIRLGKRPETKALRSNASMKSVMDMLESFRARGFDYQNCANSWKWPILLKNRKAIFKGRKTFAENFKMAGGGVEGIRKLTAGGIADKVVYDRFDSFCKGARGK